MRTKRMNNLMFAMVAAIAVWMPSAQALENNGGYTIRDVMVRQRWPWDEKVDVNFYLEKPEGASSDQAVSIGVVASNGADEVTLSAESLSGTTAVLPDGYRRIVWDPTVDHSGSSFSQLKFYLSVTSTNLYAAYMVVDLASGSIEYKEASFSNEVNSATYKTDKMAFRYIPPGSFLMGGSKNVTLTKGFYIGVFEVTQAQWKNVMGAYPGSNFTTERDMRPSEKVCYDNIRGNSSGANWPSNGNVDNSSFVGVLRLYTRASTFDLPTEAQWEYACKAGTTTYYNDNLGTPINTTSNAQMDVLGRYQYNGGKVGGTGEPAPSCGPTNGTAIVGTYLPNAWGLYDMHGNVWELCLDWYGALAEGSDPAGIVSGSNRVKRGGCWGDTAGNCRSVSRSEETPSNVSYTRGFRLVKNLP